MWRRLEKATTYFPWQRNVRANGPAVEGKLKAVIERYLNGQHAVLCPWGLLVSCGAGRQMTLKVCMDPSTSSEAKSLCPVSLTTPHGGPIMCPIWLLYVLEMHAALTLRTACFISSFLCHHLIVHMLIFMYLTNIVYFSIQYFSW